LKISFCTTCMNRLDHLKKTYPENLHVAEPYTEAEFVLVDYGSEEDVGDWVLSELGLHLESGRLKFYRTDEPRYWVAAHAKNIAHKRAGGDILCNLDADVFLPEGFCEFVAETFKKNRKTVMAFQSKDGEGHDGCAGLVTATREDFYSVNGYDESINLGWGYDDMNYQFRVRMQNGLELFTPPPIISCIPHSNEVRTANCQLKDIRETMAISQNICEEAALSKDYIANKGVPWGEARISRILPA
jgi:hypothetical protein